MNTDGQDNRRDLSPRLSFGRRSLRRMRRGTRGLAGLQ